MSQLKVVFWRDIPGQVVYRAGGRNRRLRLSPRFFRAIERATYRLRKTGEDALFDPWHDVAQPVEGNVREQAAQLVQQLEAQYTDDVLDSLVRSRGLDQSRESEN